MRGRKNGVCFSINSVVYKILENREKLEFSKVHNDVFKLLVLPDRQSINHYNKQQILRSRKPTMFGMFAECQSTNWSNASVVNETHECYQKSSSLSVSVFKTLEKHQGQITSLENTQGNNTTWNCKQRSSTYTQWMKIAVMTQQKKTHSEIKSSLLFLFTGPPCLRLDSCSLAPWAHHCVFYHLPQLDWSGVFSQSQANGKCGGYSCFSSWKVQKLKNARKITIRQSPRWHL